MPNENDPIPVRQLLLANCNWCVLLMVI